MTHSPRMAGLSLPSISTIRMRVVSTESGGWDPTVESALRALIRAPAGTGLTNRTFSKP